MDNTTLSSKHVSETITLKNICNNALKRRSNVTLDKFYTNRYEISL